MSAEDRESPRATLDSAALAEHMRQLLALASGRCCERPGERCGACPQRSQAR
jgi:hypothetical protein